MAFFPEKPQTEGEQAAWAQRSCTAAAITGLKRDRVKDGLNQRFCLAVLKSKEQLLHQSFWVIFKKGALTHTHKNLLVLVLEWRDKMETKNKELPPLNQYHHCGCQQHCKSVNEDCSQGAGLNMHKHTSDPTPAQIWPPPLPLVILR